MKSTIRAVLGLAVGIAVATHGRVAEGRAGQAHAAPEDLPRPLLLLQLDGEPAVEEWLRRPPLVATGIVAEAARVLATQRRLAWLEKRQEEVAAALAALDPPVTVLYFLRRLFNGVVVAASPGQRAALTTLPAVKAVHPLPLLHLDMVSSAPLIGAPQVWSSSLTGRGVRIGVIDTGVDYLHKAFGGSGSYTGEVFDDDVVPWTTKVVGGWDFVGDEYNGGNTARPDGDPMDCNGHGTHVAGIAAGYGVTGSGETYGGPWSSATDLEGMAVGPGVAPEAQIYALKVFGCTGSTGWAAAALEWALDPNRDGDFSDRLDVVNLSLGSSFGEPGGIYATIATNAARAGMIVVASAGNSGDTYFITGSPAAADLVISVANSVDSTAFMSDVEILGPSAVAGRYPATEASFGPNLARSGARSGQLVYPAANPKACAAYSGFAAAAVNGNVALVDRGDCTFASKVRNAQNAGAKGVLVVNNVAGEPFVMGASSADAQGLTIPSMMVSLADGARLKEGLGLGTVTAVLSAQRRGQVRLVSPSATDTLAGSSSRGPRLGDLALKPDLSAPGTTIFAPEARSSWAGRSLSGTSMAAPHVAGAMALLRQLHPNWSVEELKALVMNTATPQVWVNPGQSGPRLGAARAGAGRLDLAAAAAAEIVAFVDAPGASGRVGVSFGSPEVVVSHREVRTVKVVNKGSAPVDLAVGYETSVDQPGVEITPLPATVHVAAGAMATVQIELHADALAMANQRGADLSPTQEGAVRAWLAEESGHLVLTPHSGAPLRLPVWAAPRRRAALLARQASLAPPAGAGSVSLALTGQDLAGGLHPDAAVTPLEWQWEGTPQSNVTQAGVTTDFPDRPAQQALVAFGVRLAQPWSTPNLASVRVDIDTNGDARADWTLAATDAARARDADDTPVDVFIAQLCRAGSATSCAEPLPLNGASADQLDTAPFLSDVMVLYARVADLQLSSGSVIRYRVNADGASTGWLQFDLARPGVRPASGAGPSGFIQRGRRGEDVNLVYDTDRLAAHGSKGVLLIHHHNVAGWRAQTIALAPSGCALSCDAIAAERAAVGREVTFSANVETSGCAATPAVTWDFGDASGPRSGAEVRHAYTAPGSYRWEVTVDATAALCRRAGFVSVGSSLSRPARRALPPRP